MSLPAAHNVGTAYLRLAEQLRHNTGQWQIYESVENCVVLAGPGSGKTKTLTIKMARILAEDLRPPRGIACVTYNNECARELSRRLEKLGVQESRYVFIGSIHSFCLKNIVLPYARLAGLDIPYPLSIATEQDQNEIFAQSLNEICRAGCQQRPKKVDFDKFRRTHLNRDAIEWRNNDPTMADLVLCYGSKLRQRELIDFDDVILMGLQLVKNYDWVRKLLFARFPVLLVDEYQDLGLPFHQIVLALCVQGQTRLIAVGDPDQSIYGFTGAQPELLNQLSQEENVKKVILQRNYRCGRRIVAASQITLGEERGYNTPDDAEEGIVNFYQQPDGLIQQAGFICEALVPDILNRGNELGDIAILYVDKNDGDVIARAATSANYNFIRIDQKAPYRRTVVTRWIEDCATWCSNGWKEGYPLLSTLINKWLAFHRNSIDEHAVIELRRKLVWFLWNHRDPDMSLNMWLNQFYTSCLQEMFHRIPDMNDEHVAINRLQAVCSPGSALANFSITTFGQQRGSKDHLNLITLHSGKGSEFKVVVMMGMDQGRIPWLNLHDIEVKERRRLFYVGLTRAKHEIHITYSGWFDKWGKRVNAGPSEFVTELMDTLQ